MINTTTSPLPYQTYSLSCSLPMYPSSCCWKSVQFIIVAGTIAEVTLTFCDPNGIVQQDVSQQASGVIRTPNLRTGSAEFSPGGYAFCFVTLTYIPDYSWCGVHIKTLQLSHGERLEIQSGISGDFKEVTPAAQENKYYIPTINYPLNAGSFNSIRFQLLAASTAVGYRSRSNIELLYQGTCHNFKQMYSLQINVDDRLPAIQIQSCVLT